MTPPPTPSRRPLRASFLIPLLVLLAAAAGGVLLGATTSFDHEILVLRLRRVVLGAIVGAGLATTGAVLQAMSGNPLADPFVLGASSGAAVGYIVARGLGLEASSPFVYLFSIAGAYVAILFVLWLARTGTRMPVQTLLLAGITVSTLGTACILVYYSLTDPGSAARAMNFLMGSLDEPDWRLIAIGGAVIVAAVSAALLCARPLNAFAMGEATARHLGVPVEKMKLVFCVVSAGIVGVIVALSGLIGFVGLVIPNLARLATGSDHRRLLPWCALGGGAFVIVCDVLARTVIAPRLLTVGAVTAICGGPYFLVLLKRRGQAAARRE